MPQIESLEWLNQNSLRSYPIRDGLTRLDQSGQFVIPNDFMVDLSIATGSAVGNRYYVSTIVNRLTSVVVTISDQASVVVGTFTVQAGSFTEYQVIPLVTSTGSYQVATGKLTVGSLQGMQRSPTGSYSFTLTTAELLSRTIIAAVQGVSSITFIDDTGVTQTLQGNVTIIARTNLSFTYDSGSNTLTLDAGQGLGLNTQCQEINYITRINGVTPDGNGNISILGTGCTGVSTSSAATISISDTCCVPCSGCEDLATLTARLTQLEDNLGDLRSYYQWLDSQQNSILSTINASANCSC
jgi:hypothetical protein